MRRPVGWRGESYRHYLAARGIRTSRKLSGVPIQVVRFPTVAGKVELPIGVQSLSNRPSSVSTSAALSPEFDERAKRYLRDLAVELGRTPKTQDLQDRPSGIPYSEIKRRYGTYQDALVAAGLEPNVRKENLSISELRLRNIRRHPEVVQFKPTFGVVGGFVADDKSWRLLRKERLAEKAARARLRAEKDRVVQESSVDGSVDGKEGGG